MPQPGLPGSQFPGEDALLREVKDLRREVQQYRAASVWSKLPGKPDTFPPSTHTHTGSDITSPVANSAQADGSEYGFTNNVAGTTFYALWVGNDGGFHFGRNTSSIKYKENVRDTALGDSVLNLRPVVYDRKPTYKYPELPDGTRLEGPPQRFEGTKDELGLIAEEVDEYLPQIVTRYGGDIDGVRYDLLGVALLPVVQEQAAQIAALTNAVRELGGNI